MNKVLITICARGGSKGIPNKNIKPLCGKPLIAYSIETAQSFLEEENGTLSLSTDSLEIRKAAEYYGLRTEYTRPERFASDTAGKIDAIEDLLKYEEIKGSGRFDYVIDLDVTSPLRTVADIKSAFIQLVDHDDALNIFSVSPASRNPYFNMVEKMGESEYVKLIKEGSEIKSRQQAPIVYDMNASFYVFKREFFDLGYKTSITDRSLAYVVPHVCFDLDEAMDFTMMEIMIQEKFLDFEF